MEQKRDFKAAAFEAKVWKEELKVNSEAKTRAKKGQNFKNKKTKPKAPNMVQHLIRFVDMHY